MIRRIFTTLALIASVYFSGCKIPAQEQPARPQTEFLVVPKEEIEDLRTRNPTQEVQEENDQLRGENECLEERITEARESEERMQRRSNEMIEDTNMLLRRNAELEEQFNNYRNSTTPRFLYVDTIRVRDIDLSSLRQIRVNYENIENIEDLVRENSVLVVKPDYILSGITAGRTAVGNGIFLNDKFILTCAHILARERVAYFSTTCYVYGQKGTYQASPAVIWSEADLALLEVTEPVDVTEIPLAGDETGPLRSVTQFVTTRIEDYETFQSQFTLDDYAQAGASRVGDGRYQFRLHLILSQNPDETGRITNPVRGGFSGSMIYNSQGIVGLISATGGERDTSIYGIPNTAIQDMIRIVTE